MLEVVEGTQTRRRLPSPSPVDPPGAHRVGTFPRRRPCAPCGIRRTPGTLSETPSPSRPNPDNRTRRAAPFCPLARYIQKRDFSPRRSICCRRGTQARPHRRALCTATACLVELVQNHAADARHDPHAPTLLESCRRFVADVAPCVNCTPCACRRFCANSTRAKHPRHPARRGIRLLLRRTLGYSIS